MSFYCKNQYWYREKEHMQHEWEGNKRIRIYANNAKCFREHVIRNNIKIIRMPLSKRAYLPASATLEASLVIPLYIYAVIAVIYIIQIMQVKSAVNRAAYNSIRALSKYAYAYIQGSDSQKEVSAAAAYAMLLKELGTDFADKHYIVGKNAGISVAGSKLLQSDNQLELTVTYAVKNPFDIFGVGIVTIHQKYVTQAWLGESFDEIQRSESSNKKMVYITEQGEVYHTNRNCTYIQLSVMNVQLDDIYAKRNQSGGKYYPCEKCCADERSAMVYITAYGDRYHQKSDCSILRRIVFKVPLEQVTDRQMCSKCKKEAE